MTFANALRVKKSEVVVLSNLFLLVRLLLFHLGLWHDGSFGFLFEQMYPLKIVSAIEDFFTSVIYWVKSLQV